MSHLLAAPLLPSAAVATAIALALKVDEMLGLATAIGLALSAAVLALASADRPRQLCWGAASFIGAFAAAVHIFVPIPAFDLRHAGPLDDLREALAQPLRRLIAEPEGGILRGIVLGERAAIDPDLAAAFARSGTTHLLAISGFNMTLVAAGIAIIARGRLPPIGTAVTTVAAVVAYSIMVGLAPSVVRAALMATIAACGVAFGRRAAITNGLAFAVALMLAVEPSAIGDVGFLLSATATAGLLHLGEPLSHRLGVLPSAVREGLATTLAATLPTLPIIAAAFGRVSLIAPFANLLAVPLFPPLMLAGATTAVAGVISEDLARAPALIAYGLALSLRAVVETSAALPFAAVAVPDGPLAGGLFALAVAVGLRFGPALLASVTGRWPRPSLGSVHVRKLRPWLAGAALLGVVLAGGGLAYAAWPASPVVRVRALDIGQGDAFLVEVDGSTLLIDGGPDPARLLAQLGTTLAPWARRIDVVALTHAHADHANGLVAVLGRYDVGLAIEPVGLNPGAVATAWAQAAERASVERRAIAAGGRIRLGAATIKVLAPASDTRVDVPSLVLRLERGSFSMLFMGDATDQEQADLLLDPGSLGARVYVPPHHGAATPHAASLVSAIRPSAAIVSVGARNRYGHPTPETLTALGGIPTYRTDRDGTVEFVLDGEKLVVRTHANGLPPPRGRSVPYAAPSG